MRDNAVMNPHDGFPGPDERLNSAIPPVAMMSGREVDFYLPVVCTDRGQHKETRLTAAIREMNGELHMPNALEAFSPPMGKEATPGSMMSRGAYTFICPRCSRTPQIKAARWWELVRRHAVVGAQVLDVSLID
ncbi:hypothetical protein SAMN05216219_1513 [Mycetocola miduiensis]|uniref:Uncharacterized protein n=2 Tax=Mycetocola miduiensis TaxID=995034 RepID=A0A1I5AJH1_9MICO|nr:hypothetical protein SAMN05216219_1513 [Mycetocola miduiensis]